MKKLQILLGMFLLAGCAQDMGHYAVLPAKSPCKVLIIAPNRDNIDDAIYSKLVEWARNELPALDYTILDPAMDDTSTVCGEVVLHYSSQFIPAPLGTADTPPTPSNAKMCVNTPALTSLSRYQLTLEIQNPTTQEKFFSVSTEMESTETDTQKILSDMQSALYGKFLRVQGPESQVETKTTSNILPA